jgi:hypothetical protein
MMLFSWGAKISSLPWNPHKPFCVLFSDIKNVKHTAAIKRYGKLEEKND